jgi:hypothetical protein
VCKALYRGGICSREKPVVENNNLRLCRAVTKKQAACKKHAMSGSSYCYVHSLGHIRGVPIHKNASVHAVFGTILGIAGIGLSVWFGLVPSRAQKDHMQAATETNQEIKSINGDARVC